MEDQITGIVERIVFSSEETGFCVARLKEPKKDDLTTIVGNMPNLKPGESLTCKGVWRYHANFGRQLEVKSYDFKQPSDLIGIEKYLESGLIKGVGPAYAKRIVKEFGTDTLTVIDQTPDRLFEIEGMGKKRVEQIKQCWNDQKAIRDLMIFLRTHDVSPALAQKIFKRYADESIGKLKEDPYAIAKDIYGVGFKTADKIAQNIGLPHDCSQRVDAGIEHTLWELSNDGHVCYPKEELIVLSTGILEVERENVEARLSALETDGRLVRYHLGESELIWVKPLYLTETGIARELSRLLRAPAAIRTVDEGKAIDWVEEKLNIKLAQAQKEAVMRALSEKVQVITGGPGTGKSTITNAILTILEKVTSNVVLAAPTGRAAKRMSQICRRKSSTIHSLLEFDFSNGGFKRDRDNPLTCDLIVIDEASMIDTQLMYHLLKAIPSSARIIFIGDIDQLPSVGAGNVLKDMIASNQLPVDQLTQIFRQARGSKIVTNAHRINQGDFPDISNPEGTDFLFFEGETPEEILDRILKLVSEELPAKYGFNSITDIQVLSPMKKGGIGSENLNHHLQKRLNSQTASITRMGRSFQLRDKVMQIRNNYTKLVFNGDVGIIEEIVQEDQTLVINFDGRAVEYDFSEMDELVLAYACSIHKYQGSECPCIVIPVHTSHFKLLYRNLLYTGITRGRKLVVLVGMKKAIAIAINNDEVKQRHTGLKEILEEVIAF